MKKTILAITLILALVLSLSACGHEHAFGEWEVVTEATCTAEGLKERTCECGEKETEVIPVEEHSFKDEVLVEKTCDKDGKLKRTCEVCGYETEEVDKSTGHDFEAASIFAPKTCKLCGKTEGEALSKVLKTGDEIKKEKHSFTVADAGFKSSLSVSKGNTTYHYSGDSGKYFYAIKLNFTNLDSEALDDFSSSRLSEIKMLYQGKYNYEGTYWCPVDDIVPLATGDLYIIFEIPESLNKDKESAMYTAFDIDGIDYSYIIQNGKSAQDDKKSDNSEKVNTESAIKVGDVRSDNKTFEFTLKDIIYTSALSVKKGNTTYHAAGDGPFIALKIDCKNLGTEAINEWNSGVFSEIKLKYDGKYDYDGSCWMPEGDIVPLNNKEIYIYFNIPAEIEKSEAPLTASFKVNGNEFTVDCRNAK